MAHTAPNTTGPTDPALETFLAWRTVKDMYEGACARFRNLHEALSTARSSLQKFQSACQQRPPAIQLPASMRLRLVDQANLTPVVDTPAFYKAEVDALRQLEVDSSQKAFSIIVAARERHIEHLRASAALPAFLAKEVQQHTVFVEKYCATQRKMLDLPAAAAVVAVEEAADAAPAAAAASHTDGTFPAQTAIAHFEQTTRTELSAWMTRQAQRATDEASKSATKKVEDDAALELVLGGAHNGDTIAALAAREAQKLLAPVRSEVAALQRMRIPKSPSGPAARATAASRGSDPHHRGSTPPSTHGRASKSSRVPSSHSYQRPTLASLESTPYRFEFDPADVLHDMPSRSPRTNNRGRKRDREATEDDQHDADDDYIESESEPDRDSSSRVRSSDQSRRRSSFPSGGGPRNTQNHQTAHAHSNSLTVKRRSSGRQGERR